MSPKAKPGENNVYVVSKNKFIILIGGPGIYDGEDTAHDKAWYSYVDPIMQVAKAGTLSTGNEDIYWLLYSPAYEARWKEDTQKPSLWEKRVTDSDLSLTRYDHTVEVLKTGASDYMDFITKKAAGYSKSHPNIDCFISFAT